MADTLRIFVCGPTRSGKSSISHTISGLTEPLSSQYNPTRSLRILEFPFRLHYDATKSLYHKQGATKQTLKPATVDLNIELWDCSHENQSLIEALPTLLSAPDSAHGLILVADAASQGQAGSQTEKALENWHQRFASRLKSPNQVAVFAHRTQGAKAPIKAFKLAGNLAHTAVVQTSIEEPADILHHFEAFLMDLYANQHAKR